VTGQQATSEDGREERVVVIERLACVRSALFLILEHQPDLVIAGDRDSADGLIDYLSAVRATILLLDWSLAGPDPARLLQQVRTHCPGLLIIILSTRPEHHRDSLLAGAHAFICKGDEPATALKLIRSLVRR
jgi:DNA-binding NarL/FixJ family response regulator